MTNSILVYHHGEKVNYLEGNLRAHGETMSDYRFLVDSFTIPAVQLHTSAAGKKCLAVDLNGRLAGQLMTLKKGNVMFLNICVCARACV